LRKPFIREPSGTTLGSLYALGAQNSLLCLEKTGGCLLCAWHAYCADGLKEALSPNQREDNQQARASLVTVMSEGS
jgi:hypothetical protein